MPFPGSVVSVISSSPSTAKPEPAAELAQERHVPLRAVPEGEVVPTSTAAACSRSTSTSCANSLAGIRAISVVNGKHAERGDAISATSSARRASVVSWAGW